MLSPSPYDEWHNIPGIAKIAGPWLIAPFLNWALFGALTAQVCTLYPSSSKFERGANLMKDIYFLAFESDRRLTKVVVYSVYVLEMVQSIMLISKAGSPPITNINDLFYIATLWLSVPLLTGIVTFVCQGFFTYRIWILARVRPLRVAIGLIIVISLVQLASSVVLSVNAKIIGRLDLAQQSAIFKVTTIVWFSSSSLGDVLIAICMIYLIPHSDIRADSTRRYLQKFLRLTIGTGSVTATISITTLILALLPGDQTYYQASVAMLGKLYSNSMMVLLNSRIQILEEDSDLPRHDGPQKEEYSWM